MGNKGLQDWMGNQAVLEVQAPLAWTENKVLQVLTALQVLRVLTAIKVLQGQMDLQGHQVRPVRQGRRARLALLVQPAVEADKAL